ncbi:MAG: GNAT family N-acetyltransferase [Gammaproteobacteria bacterium]|nr:GNAT family N-acetyltransferase [Gammaproteobacteria bacterium]
MIRESTSAEFPAIGQLMVEVYSQLEGFPDRQDMPEYYEMLSNVGALTEKSGTKIFVALSSEDVLLGAVVYFANMKDYASGGDDIDIEMASGIRLLAVSDKARGKGVGKSLTNYCIQEAQENGHSQVVLHSTKVMQVAWAMYEAMGFQRSPDLDFELHGFSIYGFRLSIKNG